MALPLLLFYDAQSERVLSPSLSPLEESEVERFVTAVLHGSYLPVPRTEAEPDNVSISASFSAADVK